MVDFTRRTTSTFLKNDTRRFIVVAIVGLILFVFLVPVVPVSSTAYSVVPAVHQGCYATPAQLKYAEQPVPIFGSISFVYIGRMGLVYVPASNLSGDILEFLPFGLPPHACT